MSAKSFPASQKRLRKLRRDGQVPHSRLTTTCCGLLCGLGGFLVAISWVIDGTLIQCLTVGHPTAVVGWWDAMRRSGVGVLLTAGAAAAGAALAGVIQTRALLALSLLAKGMTELSPLRYPARIRDGATDAALGLVRGVVLISVLALPVSTLVQSVGVLLDASPQQLLAALLQVVRWSLLRLVGVVVLFGVISYGWARWRFTVRNRMSLEELREEYKQEEGDPHIRAARRHEHQALALGDLEQRVRRAKAVVVRRRESAGGVSG